MKRRTFLSLSALSASRVAGANDRRRGALIGSGGRGQYLQEQFKEIGAEMAAVCDVYEPRLQEGLQKASSGARGYDNYRKLLEDKSLDFVVIATPDHWHAQMSIDAAEVGKDVYVEKPLASNIEDGFRMVEAIRRTGRVLQVGTQRRSSEFFTEARTHMGELGDVRLVNAWWLNQWGKTLRPGKLEGKLDWKQWLGAAPDRELDPVRFFNWYFFWDYSGGLMVGQAAHVVDAINWFMGSSYPTAVTCAGGRVNLEGAEVPATTSMSIEYPEDFLAVFTVGYDSMHYRWYNDQTKQFHGTKARFDVAREWYKLWPQSEEVFMKPSLDVSRPGSFEQSTRSHIRNFLKCIETRDDPNATVEMGQHTNVALCMAMESLKQGRRMRWNESTRQMEF